MHVCASFGHDPMIQHCVLLCLESKLVTDVWHMTSQLNKPSLRAEMDDSM